MQPHHDHGEQHHAHHPESGHADAAARRQAHQHGPGAGEHAAHDKHAGHSVEMFRRKFWISLILTIPALVWEPMLQQWLGYRAPQFPGSQYIPAIFGTLVFLYGGWIFIHGAWRELSDRLPGMMTLISLAIVVAFIYSAMVTFGYPGHALWWELATLVTIMLLDGRFAGCGRCRGPQAWH